MSQYRKNGICFPKGFKANGIHCGIRKNKTKKDLSVIYSEVVANAAATYTQNKVKGAPIFVTKGTFKRWTCTGDDLITVEMPILVMPMG